MSLVLVTYTGMLRNETGRVERVVDVVAAMTLDNLDEFLLRSGVLSVSSIEEVTGTVPIRVGLDLDDWRHAYAKNKARQDRLDKARKLRAEASKLLNEAVELEAQG
jgi:hypothetical protein